MCIFNIHNCAVAFIYYVLHELESAIALTHDDETCALSEKGSCGSVRSYRLYLLWLSPQPA